MLYLEEVEIFKLYKNLKYRRTDRGEDGRTDTQIYVEQKYLSKSTENVYSYHNKLSMGLELFEQWWCN